MLQLMKQNRAQAGMEIVLLRHHRAFRHKSTAENGMHTEIYAKSGIPIQSQYKRIYPSRQTFSNFL
jgi:hypothetical protein